MQAKAVIALLDSGQAPEDLLAQAGLYGVRQRRAGWSSGLTILTAMGNLLSLLPAEERIGPLCQGVLHVARDCDGESSQPFANAEDFSQRFLTLLDTQQQVDAAGEMVYHYLTAGYPAHQLYRTLVTALVREDAGFHSFQMVEAAIQQHRELGDTPAGHWMLVAASRFLAAHAPTQRERLQTTTIAHRLHRGEMLYA